MRLKALAVFFVFAFLTQAAFAGEEEGEGEYDDFYSVLGRNCESFQGTWNWHADEFGVGRLVFQGCRVYLFPVAECGGKRTLKGGATSCNSCYYAEGGAKDDSPFVGTSFELNVGANNFFDNVNDW